MERHVLLPMDEHDDKSVEIQQPCDVLPDMQTVFEVIVQKKRDNPFLFQPEALGGLHVQQQMLALEVDNAAILAAFIPLMAPDGLWPSMKHLWQLLWRKSQLIKTLDAMECLVSSCIQDGNDLAKFISNGRQCYFRQCLEHTIPDDFVFNTVAMKMVSLLWFMAFIRQGAARERCLYLEPPDWVRNQSHLIKGQPRRNALKETIVDFDYPEGCTLPIHPGWFAHNVPLLDTPAVTITIAETEYTFKDAPTAYEHQMQFFRMFLVHIRGILKSDLDRVTTVQIQTMGALATCVTFILRHLDMSMVVHAFNRLNESASANGNSTHCNCTC